HVQLLRVTRLCDRLAVLVDDKHRLRIRVSMKDFADAVDLLQLLLVHDELLGHRALAPGNSIGDRLALERLGSRRRVTVATHQNSFNVLAHLSEDGPTVFAYMVARPAKARAMVA